MLNTRHHNTAPTFSWGIVEPVKLDGTHGLSHGHCLQFQTNVAGQVLPGTRHWRTANSPTSLPSGTEPVTLLLPGFVNAHTHLDLYAPSPITLEPEDDMVSWLLKVVSNRRDSTIAPNHAVRCSVQALQTTGTSTVADVTQHALMVLNELQQAGMAGNVALEVFHPGVWKGRASFRKFKDPLQQWRMCLGQPIPPTLSVGVAPHSPYNVSLSAWQALCDLKPPFLHLHLAEFSGEGDYLEKRAGSQGRIHQLHQALLGKRFSSEGTWHNYLQAWPAETPGILAHATYVPEGVLASFLDTHPNVYVASCPRSNLYLHQRTLPTSIVKAFGHRILLGTDSPLSCPSLDIREEWQAFVQHHDLVVSPIEALHRLTLQGYCALGIQEAAIPWVLWELPASPLITNLEEAIAQVLAGQGRVLHTIPA